jgi:branched-chain amino acid transport system substrate-binding protein
MEYLDIQKEEKMNHKKWVVMTGVLCLALMIAVLPLLGSACASPEEQTIKVGITTPSTGPAAEKGAPMGHANLDAIKYVNEELGGIDVKRFMDEGCVLYATASSKMMSASMEIANRAGFPGIASFNAPVLHRPPQHIYGQMPDYGDDWTAFAKYYMDNIWKGTGKPKMAMHLLNNPTGYGALDASKAAADALGIEILPPEEHSTDTISEIESLTRIKGQNPDVIYISSTPAPTAVIIKNAVELGLYPGVTIGLGHAGITKALVDIAGADIVEGVYGIFPTVNWGDNVPGMAKMTEYVREWHRA